LSTKSAQFQITSSRNQVAKTLPAWQPHDTSANNPVKTCPTSQLSGICTQQTVWGMTRPLRRAASCQRSPGAAMAFVRASDSREREYLHSDGPNAAQTYSQRACGNEYFAQKQQQSRDESEHRHDKQ
jgi:hypothetical protein